MTYEQPRKIITKEDRDTKILVNGKWQSVLFGEPAVYRKQSRVIAVQMAEPFRVETERGWMDGEKGDWLLTNHSDDDSSSDMWPLSAARFAATYTPVDGNGTEVKA